ncbi:hypothetical protein DIS24_g11681 [Lasiodiplodia hormozganensis]|uniref:Uncharacterized protein n=1 Tax=Lasiodiplodia hormozganensis TaxID=869390 RepID=A0AA39WNE5_9PEZI|nr:hypothetical protein DIS24_g11681 [Lasiodiplodia hormozganensis]
MQTLGIVLVVMFGLVALCLFFHFIAYTIPGWVPHEIPTRNRRRRAANRANVRNATGRVTTRNATTTTADDGIIAPGPARARAGIVVDGGPLPRLPAAAAATLLPRSASGTTVANVGAATSRPIVAAANDGSVGIQLAIVPQFVRINGGGGGGGSGGNGNSGNTGNARPAAAVPRVAGRAPPTRRAPPEYDVEAGLADPPPRYSEGLGEHDSQTVIARAA